MATYLDEAFRDILTLPSLLNGCVNLGLPISEVTNPEVTSSAKQLFVRLSAMAFCQGFSVLDEEESVTSNARFAEFVQTYRPPGSGYVSSPFFLSSVKGCVVCYSPFQSSLSLASNLLCLLFQRCCSEFSWLVEPQSAWSEPQRWVRVFFFPSL